MKPKKVCVLGLGKLGSPMAAAIASKGHFVTGVDLNPDFVTAINEGRAPIRETGLDELIAANQERLRATTVVLDAVCQSEIIFIVVPTPSDEEGRFSTHYAEKACVEIGLSLRQSAHRPLIVMTSTVLPGDCRDKLLTALETGAGRPQDEAFDFCYSPEFIALGSVIRDFLNPDFLLVGEASERAGQRLEEFYATVLDKPAPCQRMSLENAELSKVALNSYVTMKITFANTLAEICQQMEGGDIDAVTQAIGLDRRIGTAYLKGGLGFGGPCFPRDNVALRQAARDYGVEAELARSTDALNHAFTRRHVARVTEALGSGRSVGIVGMSYKPGSSVVVASQSCEMARQFIALECAVMAYDPMLTPAERDQLPAGVELCDSLGELLSGLDALVIASPDNALNDGILHAIENRSSGRPLVVYDLWRTLQGKITDKAMVRYIAFGRAEDLGLAEAMMGVAAGDAY